MSNMCACLRAHTSMSCIWQKVKDGVAALKKKGALQINTEMELQELKKMAQEVLETAQVEDKEGLEWTTVDQDNFSACSGPYVRLWSLIGAVKVRCLAVCSVCRVRPWSLFTAVETIFAPALCCGSIM